MRAKIVDGAGPRWARLLFPALGAFVALIGIGRAFANADWPGHELFGGLALWLLAPILRGPLAPSACTVVAEPGRLRILDAGLHRQTIATRDVRGASTAGRAREITLALMLRGRDAPTLLTFDHAADCESARKALGLGHHGTDALSWPLSPSSPSYGWRAIAAAALLAMGLAATVIPLGWMLPLLIYLVPLCLLPFLSTLGSQARLWLTPHEIRVFGQRDVTGTGWLSLPYTALEGAELTTPSALVLRVHDRPPILLNFRESSRMSGGLSTAELTHLRDQVRAAIRRARGEGPLEPVLDAATTLARRPREPARAWLQRLELLAGNLDAGMSYRSAGLAADDVWAALENANAPADVRAGAARVLCRASPDARRVRISDALATVRDAGVKRRIAAALDEDLEHAAKELDAIDERSRA